MSALFCFLQQESLRHLLHKFLKAEIHDHFLNDSLHFLNDGSHFLN